MTARAWLAAVTRRGGTCRLDEGRRVWVSPRTALTPALREAFADVKPAVVAALVGRGRAARRATPGAGTFPCPGCGRALPAVRRTDRDFTVCVCCKLDAISKRRAWTYEEYMRSPEWAARRELALATAGHRCQRCGALGGLEVHHRHYDSLGAEREEDLEVLCKPCHESADRERAARTSAENARALYAARLNGWATKKYGEDWFASCDEADVAEEFEDWLERREDRW
jgi:5-methylcytosine-specific restriction endonuclease McrA